MCAMYALEKLEIINLEVNIIQTICVIIKMSNSIVSILLRNNLWEPPLYFHKTLLLHVYVYIVYWHINLHYINLIFC